MRTLRLSLVGTVTLVLLGAVSGPVVGQDADEAAAAVHFSGTSGVAEMIRPPEVTTTPEGVLQARGVSGVQTNTMDDPRFSGTETWVMNEDHYGDVGPAGEFFGPAWGTSHIENDGGSWSGTFRGVLFPDGSASYFGTYVGEEGYEGLSVACVESSDGVTGFVSDCVLYPGTVPGLTSSE